MHVITSTLGVRCLIILVVFLCAAGCEQAPSPGDPARARPEAARTLYYFTWSDYVDREQLAGFEARTGARVVVDTFSSNEELLAKIQGGAGGYDVAAPSDFMVSIMIREGFLAELDLARIPNVTSLSPWLSELPFDPGQRHAVPYLWGTVGIGFDSEVVTTQPDSWEVLWDPRYRGKISMLNDQREVFGVALRAMGHSLNETTPAAIEQAKRRLLAQKPLVKMYTSENYDNLLAAGEVALAHGWGGAVARVMDERPSLRYVIPREGATIWADCLVVLRSSQNKDLAMQFINYLLETDVAVHTTNRLRFASANREVKDRVDPRVRENPAVYPPEEARDRLEWMVDVGDAIRLYDRAWTELKMR